MKISIDTEKPIEEVEYNLKNGSKISVKYFMDGTGEIAIITKELLECLLEKSGELEAKK